MTYSTDTVDDFYTGPELSGRYKVSLDTIRKWRATGYGPKGLRFGRHVRYPRAEVERWERSLSTGNGAA